MDLFILDKDEILLGILSGDASKDALHFFNAYIVKEVNKGCNLSFEVDMTGEGVSELIQEEHLVVFKDGNDFRLTIIKDIVSVHGSVAVKEVYCDDASIELFDELITVGLDPNTTYNLETALTVALRDTRWSVGDTSTVYSLRLPHDLVNSSVLYGVSEIVNAFSSEVDFSVVFSGNKIVRRLVHARRQLGRDTGKRFEYSKDIEAIKRTVSTVNLKTAILPLGKEDEETGDRVTIADVEWTVTQNGIAKPKGQLYLEDVAATAIWGYKSETDSKRPRWMYIEYPDCESPAELINYANMQLSSHREPNVTYEVNAVDLYKLLDDEEYTFEAVGIGDTVAIIDHEFSPPLLLRSRVVKIEEAYSNNNTNRKITLGNIVSSIVDKSVREQMADTVGGIRDSLTNIRDTVNTVQRTADGKNRIFRGTQEPTDATEGDLWYKPVVIDNKDTFWLLIYTDNKWDELLSDLTGVRIAARVDQVLEEAGQLKEQTEAIQEQANEAREQAQGAFDTAQGAFDTAQSALGTSQSAEEIASNAEMEAQQARQEAERALEKSDNALVRIDSVEGEVTQITADVKGVGVAVGNIEGDITNLRVTANGLQTGISNVDGRVTTLSATVNGISTSVKDLEGNVSSLEQTSDRLTTQLSDAQGNISTLQQTSTSLATRLTNAEGDISTVTQLANGLQTRVTNAEGDISTVTQLATGLQQTVSGEGGVQSQVTQLSSQYNVLVTDTLAGLQASITAVPNQISVAVTNSETGMKNYISTTVDGLVLSGSQIVLDGKTTVTGEFTVGSANIRDLNATKITGGELNFTNIKAVNFDAGNISTGTLDGIRVRTYNSALLAETLLANGQLTTTYGNTSTTQQGQAWLNPEGLVFRPSRIDGTSVSNVEVLYRPEGVYRRPVNGNFTHYINFRSNDAIRFFGDCLFIDGISLNNQPIRNAQSVRVFSTGTNGGFWFPSATQGSAQNWKLIEANNNLTAQAGNIHFTSRGRKRVSIIDEAARLILWRNQSNQTQTQQDCVSYDNNSALVYGVGNWVNYRIGVMPTGSLQVTTSSDSTVFRPVQASSFNVQSTRQSKENIQVANSSSALDLINSLKVCSFMYKIPTTTRTGDRSEIPYTPSEKPETQLGVIVEETAPEIISEEGDGVNTTKVLFYNVLATQQLYQMYNELNQECQSLKQKITELERCVYE